VPRNRTVRLAVLGSSVQRAAASGYPSNRSSAVKRRIIVGGLILLSLVLITVSFRSCALDGFQGTAASVLRPFEVGANRVSRPFRDAVGWFRGLTHAKAENARLRRQVAQLQAELATDQGAIDENVGLKKVANYHGPPTVEKDYRHVAAAVLTNPQTAIDESFTVTVGTSSGVEDGDPVVAPGANGGLVGIVDKAFGDASRVTLITDADSQVTGVDVSSPSAVGLVRRGGGPGDTLVFARVPKQAPVNKGDAVITEGSLGGGRYPSLFPRGIPIGTVAYVQDSDISTFHQIQIDPYVNLSTLQTVVVLVKKHR
jgi:rod shape-determining protein MreC